MAVEKLPDAKVRLRGTGVPLERHKVQASPNLAEGFNDAGTPRADAAGNFLFGDADAGAFTARFYRFACP